MKNRTSGQTDRFALLQTFTDWSFSLRKPILSTCLVMVRMSCIHVPAYQAISRLAREAGILHCLRAFQPYSLALSVFGASQSFCLVGLPTPLRLWHLAE